MLDPLRRVEGIRVAHHAREVAAVRQLPLSGVRESPTAQPAQKPLGVRVLIEERDRRPEWSRLCHVTNLSPALRNISDSSDFSQLIQEDHEIRLDRDLVGVEFSDNHIANLG